MPGKKDMNNKRVTIALALSLFLLIHARPYKPTDQNLQTQSLRPEFSFSGRIVFQSNMDGDNEIFLMTASGLRKLTDNTWEDKYPLWSPDGKSIAYTANPKGNYDIFTMRLDDKRIEQITTSKHDESDPAWLPSGRGLIFAKEVPAFVRKNVRLYQVDLSTKEEKKGS